jgi:surfactin synthase thioesterase subunit
VDATPARWIRGFTDGDDARVRLVCFPHAGGSATFFHPLSRLAPPGVQVLAVQYPGRQDRHAERCVTDIAEMADMIAAELADLADRPLALFGHSLGATVAFEVARRLPVQLLVASARHAPARHRTQSPPTEDDRSLVAGLRETGGMSAAALADAELLRMVLPVVRADYTAAATYRYRHGPALACRILALAGDADGLVDVVEMENWRGHTQDRFELMVFPGGHFYLGAQWDRIGKEIADRLG